MENKNKHHRIIAHSFTYAGDAGLIKENALCIRQALPEAIIVVIDDGHNSCPESIRREMEDLGVEWRVSTWNRNRNLRGKEAILGIMDEMLSSTESDDDVLLKIDSDTALLDGESLREFARSNNVLWGSTSSICTMHGCAYAVRARALKKARKVLSIKDLPATAPEDCSIADSLLYLYADSGLIDLQQPCNKDHPNSIWAGYHWGNYPLVDSYVRFSVVVTGNRPTPPLTPANRADVMNSLRIAKQRTTNQ